MIKIMIKETLTKFLPVVVVVILVMVAGGVIWWRNSQSFVPTPKVNQTASLLPSGSSSANKDLEERLRIIEEAILALSQKIDALSGQPTPPKSSTAYNWETRLRVLEDKVAQLQTQLGTQIQAPTTSKSPLYIPLGWTGSLTNRDWTTLTGQETLINPDDYPGYTSMQFEANLKVYQGNGKTYAQLFNNTDGLAIIPSEISATGENYTWVQSSTFTLPKGKKTYRVQLKSATGYDAIIGDARIKVNF